MKSSAKIKIDFELSHRQADAIRTLRKPGITEIVYGGGAGSGKSYLGSYWILSSALQYSESRWVIGRAKLKTLKETTLKSFFEVMKQCQITTNYYRYNQTSGVIILHNGSEILLKDLFAYPSDPDFDELGSLEITGAFIDEASQITVKAKNILKSRIRFKLDEFGLTPKLLMTCNPTRNFIYSEFYKPWVEKSLPENRAFIHALLSDNPYITEFYRQNLLELDKESMERLLFGNWQYLDDPTKLCNIDSIIDMWTNTHVESGLHYISCDVARFGGDKTVIVVWDGLRIIEIKTIAKSGLIHVRDVILSMKHKYKVLMSRIIVDDGGVGGGVVDMLNGCKPFVANKKPVVTSRRENFANLKSQLYFMLAEYVNGGKIWMRTEKDKDLIIEEFEQIKKDKEETDDKLRVIKKEKVKEILGRSPDYSDAIMMRIWFEIGEKDYFS